MKITGEIKSHTRSVTDVAQSRCKCTDAKSISVIHGMTLPVCSQAEQGREACAEFQLLIRTAIRSGVHTCNF